MKNKEKLTTDDVWDALGHLQDSDVVAESRAYTKHLAEERKPRFWGWKLVMGTALAAAVAALVVMLPPPVEIAGELVRTGLGETRRIVLNDGTAVTLNSETELRYEFSRSQRKAELISGEAYFQIAKDPDRRFIVRAREVDVEAIGTAFNVVSSSNEVEVLLMEGRIGVSLGEKFKDDATRTAAQVSPGELLTISLEQDTVEKKRLQQPESALAWRQGLIDIDNLPLSQAIQEFNRYVPRKILLTSSSASLHSVRISGVFRIGDTAAFISALETYFGLQAKSKSDQVIELEKR